MSIDFIVKPPKKRLHHYIIPSEHNDHKPHLVRHKALHFYSALILGIKIFVLCSFLIVAPNVAEFSTVTVNRIVELTNKARIDAGASILSHNNLLDESAMLKAKDMVKYGYFDHDSPQGVDPWEWFRQAGYNYTYAGENLAMNFSDAEEAIEAWLQSPTHRENMLNNNYNEIGVAVLVGEIEGRQTTVVVQHFGKSYISSNMAEFGPGATEQVAQVAGVTLVGGGEEIEVTFRDTKYRSKVSQIVFYTEKILLVLAVFMIINLLLTIFIRIKVQHKPIIVHLVFVLLLLLLMLALKLHFLESVAGEAVKIL